MSLTTRARTRDRWRSPLRSRLARAVFDRRQRLPDRTARRRDSADRRRPWCAPSNLAAKHGVPITPRGGGTSQAGQSIGAGHRARHLEASEPDPRDQSRREMGAVEPGVVLDELNAALRPHNLRFAPDVSSASRATVGGMMANNSSGARSVLYGKTIDHVLEQRVVLSDGTLAHFRPLVRRAGRGRDGRRQHRGARVSRHSRARRPPCRRDRSAIPQGAAARRRLQPRRLRRSVPAHRPDADHDRLRRHARLHRRREDRAGAAAEAEVGADDRVRSAARRARRDAADPEARTVRGRSDGRLHPVARQEPSGARSRSGAR